MTTKLNSGQVNEKERGFKSVAARLCAFERKKVPGTFLNVKRYLVPFACCDFGFMNIMRLLLSFRRITRAGAQIALLLSMAAFFSAGLCGSGTAAEKQNDRLQQAAQKLADADPMIRREALNEMGGLKDQKAVAYLLKALADGDHYVRGNAAYNLGRLKSSAAVEPLMNLLKNDVHPYARGQAALALARIKDAKAVPAIIAGLKDAELQVRVKCAEAAGVLKAEEGVDALIAASDGGDTAIETAVVTALGRIGSPRAFERVRNILEKTQNRELQLEAVKALGKLQRPEGAAVLKKYLRSDDDNVKVEAAVALAKLGDKSGEKICRKLISGDNPAVKRRAEEALRRIAQIEKGM